MNLLGNERSYRQLSRLADLKAYNAENKRVFGRDITNLEKKLKKNASIYEKVPMAKVEQRIRSQSLYGKKGNSSTVPASSRKDAINEYKQEILDFMVKIQKEEQKDIQKNITDKMRYILIDWLVDVHDSFELKEQTLHLALSYLSDFAAEREISKEDYQLAGITCLWIASKYEEIYPPRTKNYIEVTADTYSLKELKGMEGKIIESLNFDLNRTTSLQLLEAVFEKHTEKGLSLCKYLLELSLFDGLAKKYDPYTLVVGAIEVSDHVLKTKTEIKLEPSKKISREDKNACFKDLCILMQGGTKHDLVAIKKKYGKSRYQNVSKLRLNLHE